MKIPTALKGISVTRRKSMETGELVKAMCKASLNFPTEIIKEDKGVDEHGEYMYAGLPSLQKAYRKPLLKEGIWPHCVSDRDKDTGARLILFTLHHTSDQWVESVIEVPQYQSLHLQKAAYTLLRRLLIDMLLDLAASDTDAAEVRPEDYRKEATSSLQTPSEVAVMATNEIEAASTIERIEMVVARAEQRCSQGDVTDEELATLQVLAEERKQFLSGREVVST